MTLYDKLLRIHIHSLALLSLTVAHGHRLPTSGLIIFTDLLGKRTCRFNPDWCTKGMSPDLVTEIDQGRFFEELRSTNIIQFQVFEPPETTRRLRCYKLTEILPVSQIMCPANWYPRTPLSLVPLYTKGDDNVTTD